MTDDDATGFMIDAVKGFQVTANNEFNDGWLRYVLGEPRPTNAVAADAWDMANDTASVAQVRWAIEGMRRLRQLVVETAPAAAPAAQGEGEGP